MEETDLAILRYFLLLLTLLFCSFSFSLDRSLSDIFTMFIIEIILINGQKDLLSTLIFDNSKDLCKLGHDGLVFTIDGLLDHNYKTLALLIDSKASN